MTEYGAGYAKALEDILKEVPLSVVARQMIEAKLEEVKL